MADRTPPTARPVDPSGRPLPPQATMGLLNYLTATSLDEDYAHVSARRRAPGRSDPRRRRRPRSAASWVVLASFGLLVATAGVQTARNEPLRESSRVALVRQVEEGRATLDELQTRRDRLEQEVAAGRSDLLSTTETGRALTAELERLGVTAGTLQVSGPGIEVVVDNAAASGAKGLVYDTDLQILVNGLWAAGAEALSVNGLRITNLSAIRKAGDAITVNFRSVSPPYVVRAIGDPDELGARFVETDAASWWFNLKSLYDMEFTVVAKSSMDLPAAQLPGLRHARPLRSDDETGNAQQEDQGGPPPQQSEEESTR